MCRMRRSTGMGDHEFLRSCLRAGLVAGHASLAALGTDKVRAHAHSAVRKGRGPAVHMPSLVVLSLVFKFCCVQPVPGPSGVRSWPLSPVLHVCPDFLADEVRAFSVL